VFGTARLGSRNEKPLTRYCRHNVAQAVIGALPEWCAWWEGRSWWWWGDDAHRGLDFDALQQRI